MQLIEYQYVSDFKCLKEKCSDTCCSNWLVSIDKDSFNKLNNILADNLFKEKVSTSLRKTGESVTKYAYIEFLDNGYCPFLTEGLCEIHSRYGTQLLPELCRTYPRVTNRYYLTKVISASLSCPEIVKTIASSSDPFSFNYISSEDAADNISHVVNIDRDIRDKLVFVLRDSMINISETSESIESDYIMYLISLYSLHVSDVYGANNLRESDFAKIYDINDYFTDLNNLQVMRQSYLKYPGDLSEPLLFIISVLMLRGSKVDDKFTRLVNETVIEIKARIDESLDLMDVNRVDENYFLVKNKIGKDKTHLIEKYLLIYINNTIRRENPGKMSSVFLFCFMIDIRYSILKFLLNINAALPGDDVEKRFVEIIYLFSRAFDHDTSMMTSIYDALSHEGLITIDYATRFLKV